MKTWKILPLLLLAACTGKDIQIDRITLDQSSVMLLTGTQTTVNVRFLSGTKEEVDWYSDDESVAKVSGGIITAISKGRTSVFARTRTRDLMARCEVIVRDQSGMVAGVELSPDQLTVEVDAYQQLECKVLPETAENKTVTWESSDNSIATVGSGGIVLGIGLGEAVITATTAEGGFSASCTVTVIPKFIALQDVGLPESLSVKVGESITVTPEFIPEDATNK